MSDPDTCLLCGEIVTFCECETSITDRDEAINHFVQLARYWKGRDILARAEIEQKNETLLAIARQFKFDEMSAENRELADFEGAYDTIIQMARDVTTKGCVHSWNYTGKEVVCDRCGLRASDNACRHESVAPPNAGPWRCNDCGLTFSSDPDSASAGQRTED